MLLYLGGGAALAEYYRLRRAAVLSTCAAACGELSRLGVDRLGMPGGDPTSLAAALAAAEDCRACCTQAAALLTRASALVGSLLPVCAEACRLCAEACATISGEEEVAARCAEMCHWAEEACRRAIAASAA
jgi:hypothetical protein